MQWLWKNRAEASPKVRSYFNWINHLSALHNRLEFSPCCSKPLSRENWRKMRTEIALRVRRGKTSSSVNASRECESFLIYFSLIGVLHQQTWNNKFQLRLHKNELLSPYWIDREPLEKCSRRFKWVFELLVC